MRSHGYVPDAHDVTKDPRTSERFGASSFMPCPSAYSMRQLVLGPDGIGIDDQDPTSSCVGFTLAEGIDLHARANGISLPRRSAVAVYTFGRLEANRELGLTIAEAPLKDEGCMPTLAARGMMREGVPSMAQWPFDPAHINDLPTLLEAEQASAVRVKGWHRILSTGPQRLADMRVAISHNCGVLVGAAIDEAFEEYKGGILKPVDPEKIVGRHATLFMGYDNGESSFEGLNHWGPNWGEDGLFRVDNDWLLADTVGDIIVVTGEILLPEEDPS